MKVAIYARVSTEEQTVDNQLLELKQYCKRHNYDIYKVYSDTISGTKDSRPGLDQLLKDARMKYFNTVLVWKLDRLGRSLQHLLNILQEWEHKGIHLIAATQNIDTTTPQGKFFFSVIGAFAELERSFIVERTKAGQQRARKEGKRIGRPTVSEYHKKRIKELNKIGYSISKISKTLNVSYGTCWNVLNNGE